MKSANTPGPLRRLPLLRSQALVALALGLLSVSAWASAPSKDTLTWRFAQACSALDAGDLDGAARHLSVLREEKPGLPEARVLGALLTLRRERPALGWHEAFIQAWNDAGRPDLRDSSLLPVTFSAAASPTIDRPAAEVIEYDVGGGELGIDVLQRHLVQPGGAILESQHFCIRVRLFYVQTFIYQSQFEWNRRARTKLSHPSQHDVGPFCVQC